MKKRMLSILMACVMAIGLTCASALAAEAPVSGAVTEMAIGDSTVFVYAPENDMVVSSTCTAPCFVVFGDEGYTAETAKAEAEASGLARLASLEGATVVFVNPQGDTWAEADVAVYAALIGTYSNSSTSTFVNGIATSVNFFTGAEETSILGDTGRIYLYGEGSGADFIAANFMKSVVLNTTYPDGVTISFDRTPTSVTLFNPAAIPEIAEPADIAVAVVNGPEDTAEKLSALTQKAVVSSSEVADGFDSQWIVDNYDAISGAYRRQAGVMVPVHDWAAEGIVETVESFTLSDGSTVNYVTYYGSQLDVTDPSSKVPLVLIFHGGGNTALYHAQASEWPLIGKEHGFITVAVDLHYPNTTAAQTVELLDHLKDEYAVDASRVYASGFSMGSIKSWDLFEQYPTLFAGVAPMDGANNVGIDSYNQEVEYNTDVVVPVFYVGGQTSPLPELANQDPKIQERIAYAFSVNGVAREYTYDENVNLWWGVNGDIVYAVTDNVYFTDSTLNVHLFQSEDGKYYTALADATNMSHEVYGRNNWAAWDFLSQFSRNEDGSISISEVTYARPADGGAVTDNSYNTAAEPPVPSFTDVPADEYYYDAVLWAIENGITVGTGEDTFSPERTVTRAEMVTFLWRAAGCPEPESSANPFTDVSSEEYYYDAVLWAIENGITVGTGDGTFSPGRTVTRAEAVTFQWRAAGTPAVSGGSFEDVPSGAYYASAVAWAVENGITQGANSAGTQFSPETGVSRAQAVTFLYRQLG